MKLSNIIKQITKKNDLNEELPLLGLNCNKTFMPSIANTIGTDLSKYKIIEKGQFACSLMQVARDELVPICKLDEYDKAIMSSAYFIFEISNKDIHPDYLMMFFRTKRFDDNAMFFSSGGIRGALSWERFLDIEVPVIPYKKQLELVEQYNTINKRILIKEAINNNLSEIARSKFLSMFQHSIKNLDDKEELTGWKSHELKLLIDVIDNRGKTPPTVEFNTGYPLLEIGSVRTQGRIVSYDKVEKYVEKETYLNWFRAGHPIENDILLSTVGSIAETKMFFGNIGCIAQNLVAFRCKDKNLSYYLYEYLNHYKNKLLSYEIGSVQASIKVSNVVNLIIHVPPLEMITEFNYLAKTITNQLFINELEILKLKNLKSQLLSCISKQ